MERIVSIGIIGDYDPNKSSHPPTNDALYHAASHMNTKININWIPTPSMLTEEGQESLQQFDAIWTSSGSPYQSPEGVLRGIRLARQQYKPFFAT